MSETETINLEQPQKPKSDVKTRVMTAIPAALAVIGLLVFGSQTVLGLVVLAFALVGMHEYRNMFAGNGINLNAPVLMGLTILIGLGGTFGGVSGINAMLLLSVLAVLFFQLLFTPRHEIADLQEMGLYLFGVLWIGWSFNYLTPLKNLPQGTALIFLLLLTIWASDSFAYFGGRAIGKTPLAPSISPKKTIEGSACGVIGSGLIGAIYSALVLTHLNWWQGAVIAVVIAVIGQMGDLVESKIKRVCHVKDSGTLFPGHGGVLDRVDGFLTTVPLFYYLVILMEHVG
ncbi:MAG: phosphatidate cytidylyltransferase [SAR324 cluster bacterium]|nr:phosphatidate cytidylyltransferase [SAR324 cluster bacterium]